MIIYYDFYVSDSTVASGSQGKTGLTPTVTLLHTTGASPGTDVSTHVAIAEIGKGHYQLAYDPATYGEAAGEVDAGSALSVNSDRFLPIFLALDSSRLLTNLDAQVSTRSTLAGPAGFSGLSIVGGKVAVDLSQALTLRDLTSVTAPTINDGLAAACAVAAGQETKPNSGTNVAGVLKHLDGSTCRTFTYDVGANPTQRT